MCKKDEKNASLLKRPEVLLHSKQGAQKKRASNLRPCFHFGDNGEIQKGQKVF